MTLLEQIQATGTDVGSEAKMILAQVEAQVGRLQQDNAILNRELNRVETKEDLLQAEVARLTPDVYPAVLDALDKHCRGFVFKPITRENIGALVDAICATHELEVQRRQTAEQSVARLTQAREEKS